MKENEIIALAIIGGVIVVVAWSVNSVAQAAGNAESQTAADATATPVNVINAIFNGIVNLINSIFGAANNVAQDGDGTDGS
jgi:hypothetical protein